MRANGDRNIDDVMLINRDGGSAWSSLAIPQAATGRGDDAVAIDYDGNGLEDFVVLNGNNARGPIQLIAFYERRPPSGPERREGRGRPLRRPQAPASGGARRWWPRRRR